MKKSPAESAKNQSVEDVFRDGFAGAEPTPPPRVWENIDRILENQELHQYRKQVKWYRSIAAAALLLFTIGSVLFWKNDLAFLGQPEEEVVAVVKPGQQEGQLSDLPPRNLNEKTRKEAAEKVASVLEVISGKQAQNATNVAKATYGRVEQLPQKPEKNQTMVAIQMGSNDLMNKRGRSLGSAVTPIMPELANVTKPAVEQEKTVVARLPSNAALAQATLSAVDSVAPVKEKTILLQKPGTLASVALVTPPAEKEEEKKESRPEKWSLAVAYSPQYAYSPVKVGQSDDAAPASFSQANMANDYQKAVAEYNNSYTPTYSYSTMVGASYKINEKWQIESGLLYTQKEAETRHTYLVSGSRGYGNVQSAGNTLAISTRNVPLMANSFNADAAAVGVSVRRTPQYHTKYKYQQLGVPLRLAYRQNIKKFFAYVTGGVNVNLLVQNSITPETMQVETLRFSFKDENSPFKVWQWATSTSVGVGYEVSKSLSIIVAPELTYSLSPMLKEEQQQADAYQVGISIGGRWRLAK